MFTSQKDWEIIANYESYDLVRQRYHAKHGRTPNAAHAREIAAPFIQARRYYDAAANADRAVKPLLIYYGVVSLSRGLVLFLTRSLRQAALAPGHGLVTKDWPAVLSAPGPDISRLEVAVTAAGSFVELVRATGNRALLRANSSAVNHKITHDPIPADTLFSLGDLLARLPDVLDQLKRWQTPRCVRFSVEKIAGSTEAKIVVPRSSPYIDENLVTEIVGPGHCKLVTADAKQVVVETTQGGTTNGIITDVISSNFLGIGDLLVGQRYPSGAAINKIGQLFAISYILSMLVRYHPAFWMDLIHQRIGDAALPTIYRALDCLEDLFPKISVDFLEDA